MKKVQILFTTLSFLIEMKKWNLTRINDILTGVDNFSEKYHIAADGIRSRAPYMVIIDPTFDNLLWINPTELSEAFKKSSLEKANLTTFKALTGYVLTQILNTIVY